MQAMQQTLACNNTSDIELADSSIDIDILQFSIHKACTPQ